MKVSKAIELLEQYLRESTGFFESDFNVAVRLGLEALKRHRNQDYLSYSQLRDKLPGEVISYVH